MATPAFILLPAGCLHASANRGAADYDRDSAVADLSVYWHDGDDTHSGTLSEAATALEGRAPMLVLSVADVLLTEVALNRKQARHLQRVLPWLLEEQLLSSPDSQWFAAGRPDNGRYPVVACNRDALLALLAELKALGLQPRHLRVDAELLAELAPAMLATGDQLRVLISPRAALSVPLAQQDALRPLLPELEVELTELDANALCEALAHGLQAGYGTELLHGELRPAEDKPAFSVPAPWRHLAQLAAAVVLLVAGINLLQSWHYSKLADQYRADAAALYNQLFPGDKATALLERQFGERIGQGGTVTGGSAFLALIGPLGQSLAAQGDVLTPQRLHFDEREQVLMLDVSADTFDNLEALRTALVADGVAAEIANYRNQGETVTARIRVTLEA